MSRSDVHDLLPLSPRDYLILLGLAGGELHGYGLIGEIRDLTDGSVHMDPANLYRAVKRLRGDGLIRDLGRRGERGSGHDARRRYYGLSAKGRDVVRAETKRLERLTAAARERRLVSVQETP